MLLESPTIPNFASLIYKPMKKHTLLVAGLLLLSACTESKEKANGEVVSAIEAGGENDAEYMKEIEEFERQSRLEEQAEKAAQTSLKVDKMEHDFGKVAADSDNKCVFTVTNTGKNPLIISDVSASCGCTTPKKPEKPIAPGKSDVIEVGFKPNGSGKIEKTVSIQANTDPKITTVKVKATLP